MIIILCVVAIIIIFFFSINILNFTFLNNTDVWAVPTSSSVLHPTVPIHKIFNMIWNYIFCTKEHTKCQWQWPFSLYLHIHTLIYELYLCFYLSAHKRVDYFLFIWVISISVVLSTYSQTYSLIRSYRHLYIQKESNMKSKINIQSWPSCLLVGCTWL